MFNGALRLFTRGQELFKILRIHKLVLLNFCIYRFETMFVNLKYIFFD